MSEPIVVRFIPSPALEFAQQTAEAVNLVIDPRGSESLPKDRLLGSHDIDVQLTLDLVDRMGGRPMGAARMDRIGLRVFLLDLARQFERQLAGYPPEILHRRLQPGPEDMDHRK